MEESYRYNAIKVFLLRKILFARKMEECVGCKEEQANQLAHLSTDGTGCLDSMQDVPDQWFAEAYESLTVKQVDELYGEGVLTGTRLKDELTTSYVEEHLDNGGK